MTMPQPSSSQPTGLAGRRPARNAPVVMKTRLRTARIPSSPVVTWTVLTARAATISARASPHSPQASRTAARGVTTRWRAAG